MARGLWYELKHRNVFRVAAGYSVAAWVVIEVSSVILPRLLLPEWSVTLVIVLLFMGLPVALVLAWVYDITPSGIKAARDPAAGQLRSRVPDYALLGALFVVGSVIIGNRLVTPTVATVTTAVPSMDAPVQQVASLAVLPFTALSAGPDDDYFADAVAEEIRNALAQLPELLTIGRASAYYFKDRPTPLPDISRALGVGHLVEGTVQRLDRRIRITVQLVRTSDGATVWSQRYDRQAEDLFAAQDEIAESVAAALGLVLDDDRRARMRRAGLRDVEAFIALEQALEKFNESHHIGATSRAGLDMLFAADALFMTVIERVPSYFPAYIYASDLHGHLTILHELGLTDPSLDPSSLENANARQLELLAQALPHARNDAERYSVEAALIFNSGDWAGLEAATRHMTDAAGCAIVLGIPPWAAVSGELSGIVDYLDRQIACDPMNRLEFDLWRAYLLISRSEDALALVDRLQADGTVTNPGIPMITQLAVGDLERAKPAATASGRSNFVFRYHAVAGDVASAMAVAETDPRLFDEGNRYSVMWNAMVGRRAEANRIATRWDDAHPRMLMGVIMECYCGAPFDLEMTPNFAAQVRAAGFRWPPPATIRYPAKDW